MNNPFRRRLFPAEREVALLDVRPGMAVADLGAGAGFYDPALLKAVGPNGRLTLVEPDPAHLARLERTFGSDARVRCLATSAADLREIPTGSLDRAFLSLVLCCLRDKDGAMDELWRILAPGGRALVSYPRRWRSSAAAGGLGVTRGRWESLVQRHPWRAIPAPSSWILVRHLVEKPAPSRPPTN